MPPPPADEKADTPPHAHPGAQPGGAVTGLDEAESASGDAGSASEPVVCPFCGEGDPYAPGRATRCVHCGAYTDPLSRQATQNEMGPWFVRDPDNPFRPGCRLETLERWVRVGRVTADTVLRGPTTHQNWTRAARVPGVAHLLGLCHACGEGVRADEVICGSCGTGLTVDRDRQHLGLSPVRTLPGRGDPVEIARSLVATASGTGTGSTAGSATTASGAMAGPARPAEVDSADSARAGSAGTGSARAGSARAGSGHAERAESRGDGRTARLERRLRQAERRSAAAAMIAALFAVLFGLSILLSRSGGGSDGVAESSGTATDQSVLPGTSAGDGSARGPAGDGGASEVDPSASEDAP